MFGWVQSGEFRLFSELTAPGPAFTIKR
jgi:hypothetical protein